MDILSIKYPIRYGVASTPRENADVSNGFKFQVNWSFQKEFGGSFPLIDWTIKECVTLVHNHKSHEETLYIIMLLHYNRRVSAFLTCIENRQKQIYASFVENTIKKYFAFIDIYLMWFFLIYNNWYTSYLQLYILMHYISIYLPGVVV